MSTIFHALRHAISTMRQIGSTTILQIMAPKHGALIVAANADQAKLINRHMEQNGAARVISLHDFVRREGQRQPFVFDNHVINLLCDEGINAERARDSAERQLQGVQNQLGLERKWLQDERRAHNIQVDAFRQEIAKLKIKLAVRKVTHIRVIRPRNGKR